MLRSFLRAKLHRATVTQADPDYEGSMTIDADLMEAADIAPLEKVLVANITNGHRLETYVVEGRAGSGIISLNGAAARCGQVGDCVIIMAFGWATPEEIQEIRPRIVLLGDNNRITEIRSSRSHG